MVCSLINTNGIGTMLELDTLVGNTPLVRANACDNAVFYFKLEGTNPTQSLKDRTASYMLANLRVQGKLDPQRMLIDTSSGSFGCSLAYFGMRYKMPVEVVVNSKASQTHIAFMELCGAVITRYGDVTGEGLEYVQRLVAENPTKYIHVDQLNNPLSPLAHYQTTGPEIVRDIPNVSLIVCSMGSGATALGISSYLRDIGHPARVFVSVATPGRKITGTYLHGTDYYTPNIQRLEREHYLLGRHAVSYDEAIAAARLLNQCGILVGPQTGGVYLAAQAASKAHKISGPIVCISGDSAFKALDKLVPQ